MSELSDQGNNTDNWHESFSHATRIYYGHNATNEVVR